MQKYIAAKMVQAEPEMKDGKDGFKVVYEDGSVSWCPADIFLKDNSPVNGMPFSAALEMLKKGAKVARKGWNGKNMFLFFSDNIRFTVPPELVNDENIFSPNIKILPSIAMKTNGDRIFVGYLANQTDLLANDWFIVE